MAIVTTKCRFMSVEHLKQKQTKLRRVLRQQIRIAQKLDVVEGKHSKEAICAWDTVEEISSHIARLDDMVYAEEHFYDTYEYEELLGERMYDA